MRFIDSNSNWKTYMSSDKNMVLLPQIVFSELCGLIRKAVNGPNQLKNVLNQFAEIIPCAPTQNYSWGFLEQDINNFVKALQVKVNKGKFPVFMDCLAVLIKVGNLSPQDINEYLEDNKIIKQNLITGIVSYGNL